MDDRSRWDQLAPTVEPLTDQVLELLAGYGVQATFFVLGWIAERYPALVKRIADEGHEIASHSYWHYEVYKHTPTTFREDLKRSIDVLGDVSGQTVRGFRAPSFSLRPGCEWAWDVMLDLGLAYDASVFPIARSHGGYPSAETGERAEQRAPRKGVGYHFCRDQGYKWYPTPFVGMPTPSGRVMKVLPMSVMRLPVLGKRLAFSGGGYLRVWPWWLVRRGFEQLDAAGQSAVVYLHPWDFAPGGPALPMRPHQKFKCYHNRGRTEARLRALLEKYRFGPCIAADET